jgi:RNA polymerase sigma factor (sigma-70 family)
MTMPGAEKLLEAHASCIDKLFQRAQASAAAFGGISSAQFVNALQRSVTSRFRDSTPTRADVATYLNSLYVEDLALASACREASESAWEHFVSRFRSDLYSAARAICRHDEAAARELADSLYGELFGAGRSGQQSSGERRSLFDYFHGRSKLSTWLRAILSQRLVDSVRASRRTESLDDAQTEQEVSAIRASASGGSESDPDRARYLSLLQVALTAALAALAPRDRLRLAYYYVQDLTLAQIGRLLGEHEATASRHLDRTRRELRKQVERALRADKRLSDAQISLCYEYAMEEWPFDLTRALSERD